MFPRISLLIITLFCMFTTYGQEDHWSGKPVDFSKGDLRVSPSGRYLEYADGTRFLYLGDTAWELINRLDEQEVEQYLENRRDKGFTVIQTVILDELVGIDGLPECGHTQLIDGDISQPNPAFFEWADKVIQLAASKGLYVALLPTWGDKVDKQWGKGPEIFNEYTARQYGLFIGKRYANYPNIIWVIGGDRSGEGKNGKIWNAMATAIKEVDKRHLMTYHPQGEHSSSFWFHDAPWLDFNMIQTSHSQTDFGIYRRLLLPDLQRMPRKPSFDSEPRYENIPFDFKPENARFDDYDIRTTLYQSILSGACGYTYGCNEVWQMYDKTREPLIGANTPWHEALDMPGAWDMIHLHRLWQKYDFTEGKPMQEIIVNKHLKDDDYPVAYGNEEYILIYLPQGNQLDINIKKASNLKWMNPRTGETSDYKQDIRQDGITTITAPTQGRGNDWVLIIDNKNSN